MAWQQGQSYGQDLRDRVLAASELSARQAAARFQVSASYVVKVRARLRDAGETSARECNHVPPRLAAHAAALRARVEAEPDATLDELRGWLRDTHAVLVSRTGVWKALARLGLTLKKRRRTQASGRAKMWPRPVQPGANSSPALIPAVSCSWTRPGPPPP